MHRVKVIVAATMGLFCLYAPAASACGGFFCNNQQVMDQSGERVLFAVNEGIVQAHIQIMYQGEADRFAWVVPLPTEPTDIGVGTDTLFQQLEQSTRPRFNVQWLNNDGCYFWGGFGGDMAAEGAPNASDDGVGGGGVEVLNSGNVGPFEFHVIKGTSNTSGDAVFQWLTDNDYDQPDTAKDLIVNYVAENHVFVAVKLQAESSTGDIQPLTLRFPFPGSCVPLRLTSIAATEDMPVWVWMLGQQRAVPINYFHVEINEKKIDWLRNGQNYDELASAAVDTAAGRGFLTEYAGDTNDMKGALWQPGKYNTNDLLKITKPWELISTLLSQGYPRNAMMQNLLRKHIPMPQSLVDQNVDEQLFYNNMEQFSEDMSDFKLDSQAFVDDLQAKILGPLEDANTLFDTHRYMTRMYTQISPSEMTRDPIFLFNPDLPTVSNIHRATGKAYCKPGNKNDVEKVVITLVDGTELEYEIDSSNGGAPVAEAAGADAAEAVQRMYTSGPPEDVSSDKVAEVDGEFDKITVGLVASGALGGTASGTRPSPSTERGSSGSSSGCSVSQTTSSFGVALLAILGLVSLLALRRRRFVE